MTGITAPFFEIGPKNLLRLPEIIEVGAAAARAGAEHGVDVIVTVPTALIAPVRAAVPGIHVFAQGMDVDEPGASVARVIAEALVDAGAAGVMIGHDSSPMSPADVRIAVERARANGLMTMVCAADDADAVEIALLEPTIVLYEPPDLIGAAGGVERPWIRAVDEQVRGVAPSVLMMHAGGVGSPEDARRIMASGAAGTGSTSGVLRAASPSDAAARLIEATRVGFDEAAAALTATTAR